MKQKSLTDICVISKDPYFINRIKIFSRNSEFIFEFSSISYCNLTTRLFIIDISQLEAFLKKISNVNTVKFIVHGIQNDLAASFNAGCTDFLKDPWNYDELEARISKIFKFNSKLAKWNKLILSQKTISTDNCSVTISIEEYIILNKLIENRNEPVPREALLFALWGKQKDDSRVVDMHISNLRKKIRILESHNTTCCGKIKTIRTYGYMII